MRVDAGHQEVFAILDGGRNYLIARPLAIKDLRDGKSNGPRFSSNSYAYFVPIKDSQIGSMTTRVFRLSGTGSLADASYDASEQWQPIVRKL